MYSRTHRYARLGRTLRAALLGSVTLAALPCGVALSQDTAPARAASYNIPPGPLGAALNNFAQQAGVTLSFNSAQVQGLRSNGLRGETNIVSGFSTLLAGTGL